MNLITKLLTKGDIVPENTLLSNFPPPNELCYFVIDADGVCIGILSVNDYKAGVSNNTSAGNACNKMPRIVIEDTNKARRHAAAKIFDDVKTINYVPALTKDRKPFCIFIRDNYNYKFINDFINIDDEIEHAFFKLQNEDFLYVLDNMKVVGTLTRADINDALIEYKNIRYANIAEILNKDFIYTTFETIADDVAKIRNYTKIPLLNNKGQYITFLYRDSLVNLHKFEEAQKFELAWWEKNLKENINAGWISKWPQLSQIKIESSFYMRYLQNINWEHKTCLEIGAGPRCGYMPGLKQAKRRFIIDPLANEFAALRERLSINIDIDGIEFISKPGDYYIAELRNFIDGLIICQNALDHTTNWSFILSNIALYAKSGAYFYLWTDIQHTRPEVRGHFSITPDPKQFYRLIESLGFELLYTEHNDLDATRNTHGGNIYVSILAKKL